TLRLVFVEEPELRVHERGRSLDPPEPASNRRRNRLSGDRKVLDRFLRLATPQWARGIPLGHTPSLATLFAQKPVTRWRGACAVARSCCRAACVAAFRSASPSRPTRRSRSVRRRPPS